MADSLMAEMHRVPLYEELSKIAAAHAERGATSEDLEAVLIAMLCALCAGAPEPQRAYAELCQDLAGTWKRGREALAQAAAEARAQAGVGP